MQAIGKFATTNVGHWWHCVLEIPTEEIRSSSQTFQSTKARLQRKIECIVHGQAVTHCACAQEDSSITITRL